MNNEMPETTTTDNTLHTAQEAAQDAHEAEVQIDAPTDHAQDAHEAPDKAGREAARYRRQLRDAEAERDALRAERDALRRAAVAAVIKAERRQATPALLDAAGVDFASLLDDQGGVDPAKVLAAVEDAGKQLGVGTRLPYAPSAAGQGNVGRPIGGGERPPTFADAFKPRR
nr:hypothetical protein [Propionibacterium sp.]